jgi:hypothetical protein
MIIAIWLITGLLFSILGCKWLNSQHEEIGSFWTHKRVCKRCNAVQFEKILGD